MPREYCLSVMQENATNVGFASFVTPLKWPFLTGPGILNLLISLFAPLRPKQYGYQMKAIYQGNILVPCLGRLLPFAGS